MLRAPSFYLLGFFASEPVDAARVATELAPVRVRAQALRMSDGTRVTFFFAYPDSNS